MFLQLSTYQTAWQGSDLFTVWILNFIYGALFKRWVPKFCTKWKPDTLVKKTPKSRLWKAICATDWNETYLSLNVPTFHLITGGKNFQTPWFPAGRAWQRLTAPSSGTKWFYKTDPWLVDFRATFWRRLSEIRGSFNIFRSTCRSSNRKDPHSGPSHEMRRKIWHKLSAH